MRSIAVFLLLALGGAQAGRMRAPMPDSTAHAGAPDLDLGPGGTEEGPSAHASPASPRPSHAWVYWLAAGTAVAAGSAGWFWYESQAEPRTVRDERIFTDER